MISLAGVPFPLFRLRVNKLPVNMKTRYGLLSSDGNLLSQMLKISAENRGQFCPGLSLQWRHNERDNVSNHQPHDYLLNRLFRLRSQKTSKLRVTVLCAGNSPVTGEFPAQMASNAEKLSIWWRLHVYIYSFDRASKIYHGYRVKLKPTIMLIYSASDINAVTAIMWNLCLSGCGGTFTGATGTIKSPHFPSNYENNMHCEYHVTVDSEMVRNPCYIS